MSSSYANLEIIGSNDEQQLCNVNKMDPNSKLCVFGGLILFFFTFERNFAKKYLTSHKRDFSFFLCIFSIKFGLGHYF